MSALKFIPIFFIVSNVVSFIAAQSLSSATFYYPVSGSIFQINDVVNVLWAQTSHSARLTLNCGLTYGTTVEIFAENLVVAYTSSNQEFNITLTESANICFFRIFQLENPNLPEEGLVYSDSPLFNVSDIVGGFFRSANSVGGQVITTSIQIPLTTFFAGYLPLSISSLGDFPGSASSLGDDVFTQSSSYQSSSTSTYEQISIQATSSSPLLPSSQSSTPSFVPPLRNTANSSGFPQIPLSQDSSLYGSNCVSDVSGDQCWSSLQMEAWLSEWARQLHPCALDGTCDLQCSSDSSNASVICSHGPWADAFLSQINSKPSSASCSALFDQCEEFQMIERSDDSPAGKLAYARYSLIAQNIRGVWTFFQDWYQQFNNILQGVASSIPGFIAMVDVKKKSSSSIFKTVLVAILTTIVQFIPTRVKIPTKAIGTAASKYPKKVAQAAAGVVSNEWPTGEDTQYIQIDDLLSDLTSSANSVLNQTNEAMNKTLGFIQGVPGSFSSDWIGPDIQHTNDLATFMSFAETGSFSSPQGLITSAGTANTVDALYGYMMSEAMAQNGWYIIFLPAFNFSRISAEGRSACPAWASEKCSSKFGDNSYIFQSHEQSSSFIYVQGRDTDNHHFAKSKTDPKQSIQLGQTFIAKAGRYALETAVVCEFQGLFPDSAYAYYGQLNNPNSTVSNNATDSNGPHGFFFSAEDITADDLPIKQQAAVTNLGNNTYFIPISGAPVNGDISLENNWVELSKDPAWYNKESHTLSHPNGTFMFFNLDGTQNFDCLNQMSVAIANTWGGPNIDAWQSDTPGH